MKSTYQQLTYEQRCQISILIKTDITQRDIAELVKTTQSTISRELARNRGERGYRHKQAQLKTDDRRKEASHATKMTVSMVSFVEAKLEQEWSPEQISGWLLENKQILISHEAIYLHIWADKKSGGGLYKNLRRQGKKYDKRRNGISTRGHIKDRVCIEERPFIVEDKSRVGDWEIDTVVGKGHSGALVTIVERVTKTLVSKRVNRKTADEVTKATIELLTPYKDVVHTITADNGKEFAYHKKISEALSADVYFAHPYSSWERGLNENTNGLLRQYFPKDTDFKKVTTTAVIRAVNRLNTRPRKNLGFKTPNQFMGKYRSVNTI